MEHKQNPGWQRLRGWIPTREQLLANRWLRWLSPWLGHPRLWLWSRRGVALGVALGVFFGLLIPLAQIPLSAAAAVVLRANLPAAAASTLVSVAKAKAGQVATLAVQEGVQLHGGMGMTDEFDMGFFMKRARVLQEFCGDANFHADLLATGRQY